MCQGGIFDHIGGGFARYSVDERWLVPHFEKMLYDNAYGRCSSSKRRSMKTTRSSLQPFMVSQQKATGNMRTSSTDLIRNRYSLMTPDWRKSAKSF
jgi:hypothetical protein